MKLEEEIGELLKAKNLSLSTAESCTGGGIAALITSVPGSSVQGRGRRWRCSPWGVVCFR